MFIIEIKFKIKLGGKAKKHEFGCGFYVRGEFLKYVKDFKIVNERICYLRLKVEWSCCS